MKCETCLNRKMQLVKIVHSIIPTMHNSPCVVAIFTNGAHCKVFQKDFSGWWRNSNLEALKTSDKIEQRLLEYNVASDVLENHSVRIRRT